MKYYLLVAGLSIFLAGCGVPKSEYETLKAENARLKAQVDDLVNGEGRLSAIIDKAYAEKNYQLAKSSIEQLRQKHPESPKLGSYQMMYSELERLLSLEREKQEAEAKEALRVQNLNNTGMWVTKFYVDDFGEKTKEGFIRNAKPIEGHFSNTATQDSSLLVIFLIDGPSEISIQLFEYARNNPVKSGVYDDYTVRLKDRDGKKLTLPAHNFSDRLTISGANARSLHAALMKGGRIQFSIENSRIQTTHYEFAIENADFYENAYAQLKSM